MGPSMPKMDILGSLVPQDGCCEVPAYPGWVSVAPCVPRMDNSGSQCAPEWVSVGPSMPRMGAVGSLHTQDGHLGIHACPKKGLCRM